MLSDSEPVRGTKKVGGGWFRRFKARFKVFLGVSDSSVVVLGVCDFDSQRAS